MNTMLAHNDQLHPADDSADYSRATVPQRADQYGRHSPLLEIGQLAVRMEHYTRGLHRQSLQVISDLSLRVNAGEMVAIVGASGSGKSLLAQAILGILPANAAVSGKMTYAGEPLTPERQARLRGTELAFVPQSVASLNPLMKAGKQVRLAFRSQPEERIPDDSRSQRASRRYLLSSSALKSWRARLKVKRQAGEAQQSVFARYGLDPRVDRQYPHELSGGMARRVLVASALVHEARLIVADEPTPGLDQEVITETLRHLRERAGAGAAVLLITHDIQAAIRYADRVVVLYAGTTVEAALSEDFTGAGERLRHPYTKALWRALPENGFVPLPGVQPHPAALPPGCLFAPRCSMASPECRLERPLLRSWRAGEVRCIHAT
ncbi:ABC transporter ATP-binding protein [Paenibacillus senegalensis]|uniref:ABC transporter ATP-binding protein n=1 Tax=Paenibacillus senegalensis TaxID=1465766 RepID=UPI0002884F8B|nr:ABC transporter ATP-binding protein [Paenibacillus senegalensis]